MQIRVKNPDEKQIFFETPAKQCIIATMLVLIISAASLKAQSEPPEFRTEGVTHPQHIVDFNGDGKTDFALLSTTASQATWLIQINGASGYYGVDWGLFFTDKFVPEDYDGDNKTDLAVWRPGAPNSAAFYILQSSTNTYRIELFGQTNDDPTVVGDYDGDGKADLAVYRKGASAGEQSFWYYRGTLNNPNRNVTYVPWGQNGDYVAPGDYDGDGKNDFVIMRNNGNGQGRFWMLQTTAGFNSIVFGSALDFIVPGDYDGDGKTDLATLRRDANSNWNWYVRPSSTGVISGGPTAIFGLATRDFSAQGDYDGDGKTDFAVWGGSGFWVQTATGNVSFTRFGGVGTEVPAANYNFH